MVDRILATKRAVFQLILSIGLTATFGCATDWSSKPPIFRSAKDDDASTKTNDDDPFLVENDVQTKIVAVPGAVLRLEPTSDGRRLAVAWIGERSFEESRRDRPPISPELEAVRASDVESESRSRRFRLPFFAQGQETDDASKIAAANSNADRISPPESNPSVRLSLWNVEHNVPVEERRDALDSLNAVFSFAFDESGETLFVADQDFRRPKNDAGELKSNVRSLALDSSQAEKIALLSEENDERTIRLSPNGLWLALQNRDQEWRLARRTELNRVVSFPIVKESRKDSATGKATEKEFVVADVLAFSPNNDLVATLVSEKKSDPETSDSEKPDFAVQTIDSRNRVANQSGSPVQNPNATPFDSDPIPNQTAPESEFETIVIWDLQVVRTVALNEAKRPLEAIEIARFNVQKGVRAQKCAFSPDGTMFAVRSKSKYIGVWEAANGRLLTELGEHRQPIWSMAFSPDNFRLVVGTGETRARLVLWDIRKGIPLRVYQEPDPDARKITAVAFANEGNSVYFGTENGSVKVWKLR